jgi:hypothetical protein
MRLSVIFGLCAKFCTWCSNLYGSAANIFSDWVHARDDDDDDDMEARPLLRSPDWTHSRLRSPPTASGSSVSPLTLPPAAHPPTGAPAVGGNSLNNFINNLPKRAASL